MDSFTRIVTDAAARKLRDAFDGAYPVYAADVEQHLNPPAFFLEVVQTGLRRLIGGRTQQTVQMDVRFYPAEGGDNPAMNELGEVLTAALTFLADPAGRLYYGQVTQSEIQSGVLHTTVLYSRIVCIRETAQTMQALTGTVNTGEELISGCDSGEETEACL